MSSRTHAKACKRAGSSTSVCGVKLRMHSRLRRHSMRRLKLHTIRQGRMREPAHVRVHQLLRTPALRHICCGHTRDRLMHFLYFLIHILIFFFCTKQTPALRHICCGHTRDRLTNLLPSSSVRPHTLVATSLRPHTLVGTSAVAKCEMGSPATTY
jgi:hypothetical protein